MRIELSDFMVNKFMSTQDDELAKIMQDDEMSRADQFELMRHEQAGDIEVCGICNMGYIHCKVLN